MSSEPFDPASSLPDLEQDQPTTPFDVATLRRLREALPRGNATPAGSPERERELLAARATSAGWEELTL